MKFRQMHMDFHNPAYVENIGKDFDKAKFQKFLKKSRVNAVTLFGRCMYGYCYYYSEVFERHPHLERDLLRGEIEACNEIGVETAIYLSAGFDQNLLMQHPDWALVSEMHREPTLEHVSSSVLLICLNNEEYMSKLLAQIDEVIRLFPTNKRIFLDIVNIWPCVCDRCRASMEKEGLDCTDPEDVRAFAKKIFDSYLKRVGERAAQSGCKIEIFHNSGHIPKGNYNFLNVNSHFEMESLPTGGWGYDHFPLSAKYVQNLGKEYLGMTGRFHRTWGEFGGYKHPDALVYETSLNLALGAKCSIGDHMNYNGTIEENVARMVEKSYRIVEKKEKWCDDVENIADIALLSAEAEYNLSHPDAEIASARSESDIGCFRLLKEGKYLFTVIDSEMDFSPYRAIIVPDGIRLRDKTVKKLKEFSARGGKIIAFGDSVLQDGDFVLDFGARGGEMLPPKNYFTNLFDIPSLAKTEFLMTEPCYRIEAERPLAYLNDIWYDRAKGKSGSTFHMPPKKQFVSPFICEGADGIYVAGNLCRDYFANGSLAVAETFFYLCDKVLGKKTLQTDLPTAAVVTMQHSKKLGCDVLHLLYAPVIREGNGLGVIRELLPLLHTRVCLRLKKKPASMRRVPSGSEMPFSAEKEGEDWVVRFTVSRFTCHLMIEICYE